MRLNLMKAIDQRRELAEWLPTEIALESIETTFKPYNEAIKISGFNDGEPIQAMSTVEMAVHTIMSSIYEEGVPGPVPAPMYVVTPDMTEVAEAAAKQLPNTYTLSQMHMPSPSGFIKFDRPIGYTKGEEYHDDLPVVAASWTSHQADEEIRRMIQHDDKHNWYSGAVIAVLYTTRDALREHLSAQGDYPNVDWNRLRELIPDLYPIKIVVGYFQLDEAHSELAEQMTKVQGLREQGFFTLAAAWLMMQQPMVVTSSEAEAERLGLLEGSTRAAKKRAHRAGNVPAVQVVHLRRIRPTNNADEHTAREWSCQWMVRGHWRWQPYGPGRKQRRLMWISGYNKGPEDKPLVVKDKVVLWDR
jgi:hypothetical protein